MSTSDEAVVIWGEVLWDRFPDGDHLGGAPANVAWHLGQAGGWARLVSRVGDDDAGRRATTRLAAWVDTSLLQIDPERPTGEVTVTLEAGEPRYTLQPGRAWERIACPTSTAREISEAGVLVYGTLSQRTPEGLAGWEAAIAAAATRCTKVCDVNLRRRTNGAMIENRHVLERALSVADVIKVNDRELAVISAEFGWADPIAALCDNGRRILVVTRGAAGSMLYAADGPVEIPAVPALPGGDSVGCGDAYVALLVLTMTMGWELEASGHAAARWSSAVASVRGATPMFDDERIAALLGDDA